MASLNAAESFNSALSLFSSLYEDMNPTDLPEGLSPDNQDVWFIPGAVLTRPALQRSISDIFNDNPTIMSVADFALPSGDFQAVYLDSAGRMFTNTLSSGATARIFPQVTPGSQFKAETAFQKQFYAFFGPKSSDFSANPFVGCDVPQYYDGAQMWRVTQDAPGVGPSAVADYIANVGISQINTLAGVTIVSINQQSGTAIAQVKTSAAHNFHAGDPVFISAVSVAAYNGNWTVATVPDATSFTFLMGTTGIGPASGGTANPLTATVVTTTPHGLVIGGAFTVSGSPLSNYNNASSSAVPAAWFVTAILSSTSFQFVAISNPGLAAGGILSVGGLSAPGPRGCVVMFKMPNGLITGPSVPIYFTSAGLKKFQVTGIPLGPPGCIARILAFTPAFGANWYYITPALVPPSTAGAAFVLGGTVVNDNTSTTAVVDFSDAQLQSGTQIDAPGNNLFQQIVLAPCLGVIEYQGRLAWWGEINNIKNFVNMGFDGGIPAANAGQPLPISNCVPPGWSNVFSTGGTPILTQFPNTVGMQYSMAGAGGIGDCRISQGAYQDAYGAPILQPNTQYTVRVLVATTQRSAGFLNIDFWSPTVGFLAFGGFSVATLPVGNLGWATLQMSAATPAVIPSDATLIIRLNGVPGGTSVTIDEVMIIPTNQPVLAQQMRVSYFNNPFGYDVITGAIGLDTQESITAAFKQRSYLYPLTDKSLWLTQNSGTAEPAGTDFKPAWPVSLVAQQCGCAGPCAVDVGEAVAVWAGRYGHRLFTGEAPFKLSQELQTTWDKINWAAGTNIWLANDSVSRIIYVGLPINGASTPNIVQPVSYRSVNTAYNVPDPLHVSYSGRLICTDLCRKSTRWSMTMNCGAMVTRTLPNGGKQQTMMMGGGNGLAPGVGSGFGNLYTLSLGKFTDDDYGVIPSFYTSYFFFNHDLEQNVPVLSLHRKIYTYLSAFVTGVGNVQITPLVDSLLNPWNPTQQYSLSQTLTKDLEWRLNVRGDRVAFKVAVTPLPGQTDAAFNLQHMVVSARADKVFPVRGAFL